MSIKYNYPSPRWSQEILDCSMPMTMDTYSRCSANCAYCFAFFQKSHCCAGYMAKETRALDINFVKNLFVKSYQNKPEELSDIGRQFYPYIADRKIMQWGALADQFDGNERKYGVTLNLLKFFHGLDYPLSFSTKFAWWTQDKRYMDLFVKHRHNWHVKVSIITLQEAKSRRIEAGSPRPLARLKAIQNLAAAGLHVTLRLRPYIIGASEDWKELITQAARAGADSVSTELFCMDGRADAPIKARYAEISKVIGYDIMKFYRDYSVSSGYKRLNEGIKRPIFEKMRDHCHDLGLRFNVSDAFCRDLNDSPNCCGVPPDWNSCLKHFGGAILEAQEKGEVSFDWLMPDIQRYFGFRWVLAKDYNTSSSMKRSKYFDLSMAGFFRWNWNKTRVGASPARMYGSLLTPARLDSSNNIVYQYTGPRKKRCAAGSCGCNISRKDKLSPLADNQPTAKGNNLAAIGQSKTLRQKRGED